MTASPCSRKAACSSSTTPPAEILGRPATAFVADFVGADRGVRRLAVVRIESEDLAHRPWCPPTADHGRGSGARPGLGRQDRDRGRRKRRLVGWVSLEPGVDGPGRAHTEKFAAQVPLGTTLRAALGEMLQHDMRWIPVVDDDDHYLGVLTPNRLHAAMRRSVGGNPIES